MSLLAPKFVSSPRHGFCLVEQVLKPIRELCITARVCVPLLPRRVIVTCWSLVVVLRRHGWSVDCYHRLLVASFPWELAWHLPVL